MTKKLILYFLYIDVRHWFDYFVFLCSFFPQFMNKAIMEVKWMALNFAWLQAARLLQFKSFSPESFSFLMKMPSLCVFSLLQASGVSVPVRSVALVGFRQGQYGASTWRAGPPITPTAITWRNQKARDSVLKSATGTRTSSSGRRQSGGAVFLFLSFPMSSSWGQLSALQHSMGSRGAKSTAYAPQIEPQSVRGYVNSFPKNHLWSRHALSPAPRTVWFQTSTLGQVAAKPAVLACSIGLDMFWPHQCMEGRTAPT